MEALKGAEVNGLGYSSERLLRFVTLLDRDMEIVSPESQAARGASRVCAGRLRTPGACYSSENQFSTASPGTF